MNVIWPLQVKIKTNFTKTNEINQTGPMFSICVLWRKGICYWFIDFKNKHIQSHTIHLTQEFCRWCVSASRVCSWSPNVALLITKWALHQRNNLHGRQMNTFQSSLHIWYFIKSHRSRWKIVHWSKISHCKLPTKVFRIKFMIFLLRKKYNIQNLQAKKMYSWVLGLSQTFC